MGTLDDHLQHSRWLQPELQAFPSQIKISSEAIKMSTHVLLPEPHTAVGSGAGGRHDGKRNAKKGEEWASVPRATAVAFAEKQ